MQITIEEARKLIGQQQVAHKLLAGFYQNILANFDRLANTAGFAFMSWNPTLRNRPCQNRINPSSRWIWDFLPLYDVTFAYKRQDEPLTAQPGNCIVVFRLYCDEGFREEYRIGYADPIDLESRCGSVELIVYRCTNASSKSCSELYDKADWPKPFDAGWQDVNSKNMKAYYQHYLLEDFITGQDLIQSRLDEITSPTFVMPSDEPAHELKSDR